MHCFSATAAGSYVQMEVNDEAKGIIPIAPTREETLPIVECQVVVGEVPNL